MYRVVWDNENYVDFSPQEYITFAEAEEEEKKLLHFWI